ncbi:MAG TPA: pseudouridine synthase [Solirubrobacteraceae bacterium]|jgi:23S rRNA pseudouridine2605 synthase|nr:pseudouridine synthase [Solirubrobacteraceae bacterium]
MVATVRLAKYLAHSGVASRRAATEIVRAGRVRVDGVFELDPARQITTQRVELDGAPLAGPEELVVYALNKPAGVVSTARGRPGRSTVVELIDHETRRLYPVGRLDAATTGLILLTNDGELANLLTHPRYEVPKTYRATLAGGSVSSRAIAALERGIELDDGRTAPAAVKLVAPDVIEIEIHEGRKRQVRRMCEAVGHPVRALERVRFGSLELGRLPAGAHRLLSQSEVEQLRAQARR